MKTSKAANLWAITALVLLMNLALGIVLWFDYLTDYSWTFLLAELTYPVLVLAVALASMYALGANNSTWDMVRRFAFLPSLAGGVLFVLMLPGTLVLAPFILTYELHDAHTSPDGHRIAEELGAPWVDAELKRIHVYDRSFPIVQRIVCVYSSYSGGSDAYWQDSETLLMREDVPGQCVHQVRMGTAGPPQELFGVIPIEVSQIVVYGPIPIALSVPIIWCWPEATGILRRLFAKKPVEL